MEGVTAQDTASGLGLEFPVVVRNSITGALLSSLPATSEMTVYQVKEQLEEHAPSQYQALLLPNTVQALQDDETLGGVARLHATSSGVPEAQSAESSAPTPLELFLYRQPVEEPDLVLKPPQGARATAYQLEHGADPNFTDQRGKTALIVAAKDGAAGVVTVLLAHPRFALVNALDRRGRSALHWAAAGGHSRTCSLLLSCEAFTGFNALDDGGNHALHLAAGGHLETCRVLTQDKRIEIPSSYTGTHPLLHAAACGAAEICTLLLDWDAPPAERTRGRTALHIAAELGHTETCRTLLDHPCFTLAASVDHGLRTALHCAADLGKAEICKLFLAHLRFPDAAINALDNSGRTALCLAAKYASGEACEVLAQSPRVTGFDNLDEGRTLLLQAAKHGLLGFCRILLEHPEFTVVNARNAHGRTALHLLAERGSGELVTKLLEHPLFNSADVRDGGGEMALHLAAAGGHFDTCGRLLKHHLSKSPQLVAAKDEEGRSALHLAAAGGHFETCQLLMAGLSSADSLAPVWTAHQRHGSPLHEAASRGFTEICTFFLSSGGHLVANLVDSKGGTALHAAVARGHPSVWRALLKDPNFMARGLADSKGQTALHLAVARGDEELCQLLLTDPACSATAWAPDNDGCTALHLAAAAGHFSVVELLLRQDCSFALASALAAKDKFGFTAVSRAASRGHTKVVATLEALQAALEAESPRRVRRRKELQAEEMT